MRPTEAPRWGLLIPTVLLVSWIAAAASGNDAPRSPSGSPADSDGRAPAQDGAPMLREGAKLVDVAGTFRNSGGRVEFCLGDSQQRLVVLENLALERIAGSLAEVRSQRLWTVSGTVSEFRGTNYLFVARAVLKTDRSPAAGSGAGLPAVAERQGATP